MTVESTYTNRRQLLGKERDLDALWSCITAADAEISSLTERCEGAEISMIDRGDVIARIADVARQNATAARANARTREERSWLDVLAIIEHSPS